MPDEPGSSVRSENGLPHIQATPGATAPSSASANPILHVPVSDLYPGNVNLAPHINNPLADDPSAATRGMQDFIQFNCVGCHAPNGGGGMGPSSSDRRFIYGADPAEHLPQHLSGTAERDAGLGRDAAGIDDLGAGLLRAEHQPAAGPEFRQNDLAHAAVAEGPAGAGGVPADDQSLGLHRGLQQRPAAEWRLIG